MSEEPTWFVLYGGTSPDGRGDGVFKQRTKDPVKARHHFRKVKADPYSTGSVRIITDTSDTIAWTIEDIE